MGIDNLSLKELEVLSSLAAKPGGASLIAESIAKSTVSSRRRSPNGLSFAPYYKEKFAKELEGAMRDVISDKKSRIVLYSDFPQLRPHTVYLRVYQSFTYACDKIAGLENAKNLICLARDRNGIILRHLSDDGLKSIVAHELNEKASLETWRAELDSFITDADIGTKFTKEHILLTAEEQNELRIRLAELPGIISVIKEREIRILKIDPEKGIA